MILSACARRKLIELVLGVVNLFLFAKSFVIHHQQGAMFPAISPQRSLRVAHARRDRRTSSTRLAPGQEQQSRNESTAVRADVSDFEQTSGPVKAFVGGLTDLFVCLSPAVEEVLPAAPKVGLSVEQLEAGIRQEYAKNYLWTGDINEALYEEDCSFTDPTLSFSGLSTYKRNVGSLQSVLDRLVYNSRSVLYSCELRQEASCVQTRWRMVGDIRLPWGPTIDVVGRTTFSFDPARGNRIFSYDEVWEVEPLEALLQLFKPGKRDDDSVPPQD